jgi:hypothetical protein
VDNRQRVRFITMAWGERYIHELFDFALAAVLAPNNLPALSEHLSCEMVIVTEEAWFDRLRQHPIFHRIEQYCPIELRAIDEFVSRPDAYGMALTYALFRGFEDLGASMLDVNLIFFNADFIMADGALRAIARKIAEGERLILSPSYCVSLEKVGPWLMARRDTETGIIAVPPREMAAMAIQHRHNTIRGKTVNQRLFSQEWIDQFYWLVDQQTLIAHQLPIAVVCMRPERVLTEMRTYWDYGIISESCPTVTPCVLADSDDFLMIEIRQADTAREQIALGWPTPKQIADKLNTFMTDDPLSLAHYTLILHSGDLPPGLEAAKAKLDAFVNSVLRELPPGPWGHIDHPIWLHHYAKFQEARHNYLARRDRPKGGKEERTPIQGPSEVESPEAKSPKPNAPRMLEVGAPASTSLTQAPRQALVRRLARQIYGGLLGFSPTLQPAHPRWPDVQPVVKVLEGRHNGRILVVSSTALAERLFRNLPGAHINTNEMLGLPTHPTDATERHQDASSAKSISSPRLNGVLQIDGADGLSVKLSNADFSEPRAVQVKSLKLQLVLDESTLAQIEPPNPASQMSRPPPSEFTEPEVLLPCGAFDVCVCELGGEDLLQLRRIVALIAPAVRRGGKILVFHLNQSAGALSSAQNLIKSDSLTLDLPCQVYFSGSALTAKAAHDFGGGIRDLRTARPRRAARGAFALMRSILLARRVNRAFPPSSSNRAPGACTSVTIEIDVLPKTNASPHGKQPISDSEVTA